ncbi:MAG: AAA family ATPase, partial [Prevotellaceae bacterium]|nr:AAA family ATPase [Prevotellaceae bacterium]
MRNLPIGIQSFEDISSKNYLYVDKTELIYRIVSTGKIYFLSRPRRFGKSLLISTMEALFRGRKDLFKGLYIYDKWDWEQQYPVIRIDWTRINHSTPEIMERRMCRYLSNIAEEYGVSLQEETASDCFDDLIRALRKKTGKNVVVLIDEYDCPVIDNLFNPKLDIIRKTIHDFYRVMKGADDYIQFIFITGISKFSGLSIFSA